MKSWPMARRVHPDARGFKAPASLIQLIGVDVDNALDHSLEALALQATGLSDGAVRLRRGSGAADGLHCLGQEGV